MKKLVAMLLSAAMIVGLVACSGSTETVSETAAATTAATTTVAETTVAAAVEEATEAAVEKEWLPLVKDGEKKTITIGMRENANTLDYEDNEFTKYLEEKTGVDIEFVMFANNIDEAKQQFALMVAAGEKLPDILYNFETDKQWGFDYGEQGYFIDLTEYYANEDDCHFFNEKF